MVNIRVKGADAEREICNELNAIILSCMSELGYQNPLRPIVQRNQNQSAVGGKDLSNTFDLAIEVKRQETLNVNGWWKQCVEQAARNAEKPVLLYRQSRQKWRVVMMVGLTLPGMNGSGTAIINKRGEISWEDFLVWFRMYAYRKLRDEAPKV